MNLAALEAPPPADQARRIDLDRGPNVSALPDLDPLPAEIRGPVLLKAGDDVSTDEISPAGAQALPYRSNIPKLADFTLTRIDPAYPARAAKLRDDDRAHLIVAGENWGQGSSREHAAICPRYLGLRAVLAKSFARIHWQNLANFGVLALEFTDPADHDRIKRDDELSIAGVRDALADETRDTLTVRNETRGEEYTVRLRLSARQRKDVLAGGTIAALA
jgi:aconitate hydratase